MEERFEVNSLTVTAEIDKTCANVLVCVTEQIYKPPQLQPGPGR